MPDGRFRVIRVIADRGTGHRWWLVKQLDHRGPPALLLQLPDDPSCRGAGYGHSEIRKVPGIQSPVIHPGDSILVSDVTAVSEARLEATALESASMGDDLKVRLKFGGNTLRVVATAPGRATVLEQGSGGYR